MTDKTRKTLKKIGDIIITIITALLTVFTASCMR